jgi:hypothetical protein
MDNIDESFTYMICSDERKNTFLPAGQPLFYDIDFGGFSEKYDSYNCQVIAVALGGNGVSQSFNHLFFCCNGLAENGYFCKSKLNNQTAILAIVAMSSLSEILVQNENGHSTFRVNNCRTLKQVRFSFLKADLTPVLVGGDLNNVGQGGVTPWAVTFKMTPIK